MANRLSARTPKCIRQGFDSAITSNRILRRKLYLNIYRLNAFFWFPFDLKIKANFLLNFTCWSSLSLFNLFLQHKCWSFLLLERKIKWLWFLNGTRRIKQRHLIVFIPYENAAILWFRSFISHLLMTPWVRLSFSLISIPSFGDWRHDFLHSLDITYSVNLCYPKDLNDAQQDEKLELNQVQ